VKADRVHLYNSVSNIIDNALKYGGGEVKINILVSCTPHELLIEITDNGPGIPAQNLPYIFDKFYRVPSPAEHKIKGFGLGLYYTQSIIKEHGGWCRVESEPGKGTTFKIGLPK
jgi:two-component system, OmpR family, phosphate regulon sensor histidine kinase PhoR